MKEIKILDMKNSPRANHIKYSILAIGFNNWHLYWASKSLYKELLNLEIENFYPHFTGSSTTEWCIVSVGKLGDVHFLT